VRSTDELRADCARILKLNDRERHGRRYTVPSARLYPHQWAWDSAFIAIGWAHLGEAERAWEELRSLLDAAWTDGRIPHIVFHDPSGDYFPGPDFWETDTDRARDCGVKEPRSSSITQPPVFAQCAARVAEVTGTRCPPEILRKLEQYHRWCFHDRDPEGWSLFAVCHPWESGMDNSPRWDAALSRVDVTNAPGFTRRDIHTGDENVRPTDDDYVRYCTLVKNIARDAFGSSGFSVYDPALSTLLALDLRAFADLADGRSASDAVTSAKEVERQLRRLWREDLGRFIGFDVSAHVEEFPIPDESHVLGSYFPLLAGLKEDELRAGLERDFLTCEAPLPSTAPSDPAFEARRYWRGPTWLNVNWLFQGAVPGVREKTLDLARAHGCWEYYDPTDGSPLGAPDFGWSAALTLDLLAG
jgi:glycogen debranching enzyme